jgi:hypothetical protein
MLHPLHEIAHFMNWSYYSYPFHELASTLARFTNWAILSAQFMNWADLYVAFEVRLLAYSYFYAI